MAITKVLKEEKEQEQVEQEQVVSKNTVLVKPLYTFSVNLGFGNVYNFVENEKIKVNRNDYEVINQKFPGMLELVK